MLQSIIIPKAHYTLKEAKEWIIKHNYKLGSKYMQRIIRAHKVHHKNLTRESSQAFGFLFADKKFEIKKTDRSG